MATRSSVHPELFGHAVAVTNHDSNNIPILPQALQVRVTGNFVVVLDDDTTITYTAAPVGMVVPYPVKRVNSTGSTASLVALY